MRDMPIVSVLPPDAGEVRPDASGAEQVRAIMDIFTGPGHRSPPETLPGDRTDVL